MSSKSTVESAKRVMVFHIEDEFINIIDNLMNLDGDMISCCNRQALRVSHMLRMVKANSVFGNNIKSKSCSLIPRFC